MGIVSTVGTAKHAKEFTLWMPVANTAGIVLATKASTPDRIPMSTAIVYVGRAIRSSHRTKPASTTGTAQHTIRIMPRMPCVPKAIYGIAKRAKQPSLWMPVAIIPGIAREINKSTPDRIPMSQAIACARRAKGSSRRTKTARTTGIVRRKANTTRQMLCVPRRILIAGIARMKHVERLTTSGRCVRIPGTAPFVHNVMR